MVNMGKIKKFLKRKEVEISLNAYGIKALGAMAQGLFATLLIGTILNTLGMIFHIPFLSTPLFTANGISYKMGDFAITMSGVSMALAIGNALKTPPLVLFSLSAVGYAANLLGGAGGPLSVLIVSIITSEIGKIVSKETKIDIIITPLTTVVSGILLSYFIAPSLGKVGTIVGEIIMLATRQNPLVMGIVISVVVGMALTLPISSAAICAAISLTGLAGGAALAGCCANMIGFATMSFKENKISGLISQGLGTSMLQMPNIIKNPKIWIPPIITSVITGILSTVVFKLEMNGPAVSSGMGTCGMVGPIGVYLGWISAIEEGKMEAITSYNQISLWLIALILPAIITPIISKICIHFKMFKSSDLKIN